MNKDALSTLLEYPVWKCLENGFSSKIGHVYKIGFSDDVGQPFPVCQFWPAKSGTNWS